MSTNRIARPETREITFRSGRTAVIREVLSAISVFDDPFLATHLEAFEAGALSDAPAAIAITRKLVGMMLVDPRLAEEDEEPGEGVVALADLYEEEIEELVDLWKQNIDRAARFREGPNGAAGGKPRAQRSSAPKSGTRSTARKR